MKSIYLIPCANKDFFSDCVSSFMKIFAKKYSKIVKFAPIVDDKIIGDENYCFTQMEAATMLAEGKSKELIISIIKKYKELQKNSDYVLTIGYNNFDLLGKYSFNVELAKELDAIAIGVCKNVLESKILRKICKENNLDFFGIVDEAIYCCEDGEKKCTLPELLQNSDKFLNKLSQLSEKILITPSNFEYLLLEKAKSNIKTIVLPESEDERILKAAENLSKLEAVKLILIGEEKSIKENFDKLGLKPNCNFISFISVNNEELLSKFSSHLYELRKNKGMTKEEADKKVKDKMYFSTILVELGYADGMVAGANTTTATTIRPALQIIKTKPGVSTVSGLFFMCFDEKVFAFADCAVNLSPNSEQLASIAISSADTFKSLGYEPKVAMLSYSSGNSGTGPSVDIVKEATKLTKELSPELKVDGPLQFDAAISKTVALKKMPDSPVAGEANVFVFPDLNAGNIGYKAVQRASNCLAIGPVLQGLKKPVNDLSRGCNVDDIVNTVLITSLQAK